MKRTGRKGRAVRAIMPFLFNSSRRTKELPDMLPLNSARTTAQHSHLRHHASDYHTCYAYGSLILLGAVCHPGGRGHHRCCLITYVAAPRCHALVGRRPHLSSGDAGFGEEEEFGRHLSLHAVWFWSGTYARGKHVCRHLSLIPPSYALLSPPFAYRFATPLSNVTFDTFDAHNCLPAFAHSSSTPAASR